MTGSRTYTLREVATILGVPYSTLAEQARTGRADHLRPIRVGTRTVFPRTHIDHLTQGAA